MSGLLMYRLLLWLLAPPSFRRRFGASMEADAAALVSSADRPSTRARACVVIALDLLSTSWREWRAVAARSLSGWRGTSGDGWSGDLMQAVRVLRRSPGLGAGVVLTLAIGIAATTVLFSVMRAVVLAPLPFDEPDRLVRVWEVTPQGEDFSMADANFLDFRDRNRTLEGMGAVAGAQLTLQADGEAQGLSALRITPGAIELLRVSPLVGRTFRTEEGQSGGARDVVLLGEAIWERQFEADPGIVGRVIQLDGRPHEIVGVLPGRATFPWEPEIWVPLAPHAGADRSDHEIEAIARLRPGVSLEAARADLASVAAALGEEYPGSNAGWTVSLRGFPEWVIGPRLERTMAVLFAAGALLLLVACTNASNLLLVRATARAREMGVRAALGASRYRILRQLVLEATLLSFVAGLLGAAMAYTAVPLLVQLAPAGIPRLDQTTVDIPVLLFALCTALLAGVGFGLVPAVYAVKQNVFGALRSGTRVEGARGRRARRVLLVAQLALALVVLVGAALLQSSFQRLQAVELGFDPDRIVAVPIAMTAQSYRGCPGGDTAACDDDAAMLARLTFLAEVTERLNAIPGVEAAGATNIVPLSGSGTVVAIAVEGQARRTQAEARFADWRAVTPGFFPAMGLQLRSGRNFTAGEAQEGGPVVIVSAAFAASFLPGEEAVGRRIAFGTSGTNWRTIVGVVGDIRDRTVEVAVRPMLYFPQPLAQMTMLVRTAADDVVPASAVRRAIASVDASMPLPVVRPLAEYRRDALAGARFSTLLMSLFAACALVLAVLGVYAVTLYEVTRRTREFGLRVALGAGTKTLLQQVLGESARPLILGLAIGMAGALGGSYILRAVLFEAGSIQPIPFGSAVATLVASVMLASLVPALRATRVDPAVALSAD